MDEDAAKGCLLIISLLVFCLWLVFPVGPYFDDEVIVLHGSYCDTGWRGKRCRESAKPTEIKFRIVPERAEIIVHALPYGFTKYTDCSILDKENWSCGKPDTLSSRVWGRYSLGMDGGEIKQVLPHQPMLMRYISRWSYRWWWLTKSWVD